MNKENENNTYSENNEFNNQGINNEPDTGKELGNAVNSGFNFAKGVKTGANNLRNSPAFGLKNLTNSDSTSGNVPNSKENQKKDVSENNQNNNPAKGQNINQNNNKAENHQDIGKNKNDNNSNNPAKGQDVGKDNKNKSGNPLPGAADKPDNKKGNTKDNNQNVNDNKKSNNDNNKKVASNNIGKNKQGGLPSRFNPLNRLGLGKKDGLDKKEDDKTPGLNQTIKSFNFLGFKLTPIQVRIAIGAGIALFFILAALVLLAIFGGTTAAVTAAMCGEDSGSGSGSSYNGPDYKGSADEKEFLCKMQDPLGKRKDYIITSLPGPRWGSQHNGIDLAIGKGTPIYAVQSGVVAAVNDGCYDENRNAGNTCGGGAGNYVFINHGGVITTQYMHMVNGSVKVKAGDKVGKGQLIGEVASSGSSTGYHLHFGMLIKGSYVYGYADYFLNMEKFKKNCGSQWDGELAGDSANAKNDTTDYVSTGSSSSDSECCDPAGSSSSSGEYCKDGITVVAGGNNSGHNADPKNYPIGTFDLEEYIPMVVSGENGGANSEALKAQTIAARTYTINRTNNCKKTIRNSTEDQVANKNVSDDVVEAVNATNDSVMLYNGKVFSAEYDSYYVCNDFKRITSGCSVSYQKSPSSKTHTVKANNSYCNRALNQVSSDNPCNGHGRGMSQLVARQLEEEGKDYKEILEYFYADGVEITGSTNTCTVGKNSFDGEIWVYYQYDYPNVSYGDGTIADSGCGPTAMAMVVSSFLNEEHDPVELAEYAMQKNHYVNGVGTAHAFFADAAKKYGFTVREVSKKNYEEVLTALNRGDSLVIAPMGKGPFTDKGHFILLTGTDGENVMVQDPGSEKRSKTWNFEDDVLPTASRFFIFKNKKE